MATDTISDFESDDDDDLKIVINIGGTRHETKVETLMRRPGTRLSSLAKRHRDRMALAAERSGNGGGGEKNEGGRIKRKEYFFDRHPGVFTSIIDYYRSGRLIYTWYDSDRFLYNTMQCIPAVFDYTPLLKFRNARTTIGQNIDGVEQLL